VVHARNGHRALQGHTALVLALEEVQEHLAVRVELQRGVRGGALVGVVRDTLLRRRVNLREIKIRISKAMQIKIRKYFLSLLF